MLRRVNSSARGSSPCSSLSAAASSWTERGQLVRQGADQGSVSVDCKHGGLLILSPGGRVLDRGAGERAGRQRCGGGAREEGGNVVDLPVACGPHPAHPATVRTRVLSGAGTEGSAEMLGARLDSATTRGRVSLSPAGGRICGIRRLPLHQDERAQPHLPGDRPQAEVPGGDLPLGAALARDDRQRLRTGSRRSLGSTHTVSLATYSRARPRVAATVVFPVPALGPEGSEGPGQRHVHARAHDAQSHGL